MEAADSETAVESTRATRDGVKSLLKAQNVLLDYVAEQNAVAFKIVRERMKAKDSSPAAALVDSVEEIVEGVVAMQRSFLGMGEDRLEREPAADGEPAEAPAKERKYPTVPFGQLLRKNFETAVAAQREILGLVEKQGKLGVKAAKEIARFSAGRTFKNLASMAKESVDNVIATETSLADLAAKRSKESIALIADQEKSVISISVARAMEDGIENLHRAQTGLLKIAGDLNAQVYERAESAAGEATGGTSTFADRVESGIERLVKTQNELLDMSLLAVNRTAPAAN